MLFYASPFFGSICCAFLLIATSIAPHLNPHKWWTIALSGFLFPFFIIFVFLFIIFWIFIDKRKALLPFAAVLISIPNIISTFGFTIPSSFVQGKEKGNLRIVTWNTGLMNYTAPSDSISIQNNEIILRKLKETNADIICLQEFFTAVIPGHQLNFIDFITKKDELSHTTIFH